MQQRNATERPTQQPLSFSTTVFTLEFLQIRKIFIKTCFVPVFDRNDKWFEQNISQVSQSLDEISHKHLSDHVLVDLGDYGMGVEVLMVAQMGNFLVDDIVVEDMHSVSYMYSADTEGQILTLVGCIRGLKELERLEQSWVIEHTNSIKDWNIYVHISEQQSLETYLLSNHKLVLLKQLQQMFLFSYPRVDKFRFNWKALCLKFGIRGAGKGENPRSSAIFHVAPITFLFCLLS